MLFSMRRLRRLADTCVQRYEKVWKVILFLDEKLMIKTENRKRKYENRRQMAIFIADLWISDSKSLF